MRTLRTALAAATAVALVGGLPMQLAAQDPAAATWTHVTGVAQEEAWDGDMPNDPNHEWDYSVEYIPGSSGSYVVEWSDPRLPTTMRTQVDAVVHHGDMYSNDDWMLLLAESVRLDDPDGAWTGSSHGVFGPDGEQGQTVLEGEGAYEGLSAVLAITWTGDDYTTSEFDGWILESALPEYPDPVEVPAV